MSQAPLFTAAIICFNRATLVRAAIESVLAQECQDYELVLVDDASTDGSAEVIRKYADRSTIVVREQNGGEMAARNTAMEHARGEYVCFLDSDDIWFPWTLATYAEAIRRHGRPSIVGGRLFFFSEDAQLQGIERGGYADRVASCYLASAHYFGVIAAAIRRTAIEQVGNFIDVRLNCMDSDLMMRIGDSPGFVEIQSPYTLAYREQGGILGNTEMSFRGTNFLIDSERAGKYPGGSELRLDRLRHVAIRTRNISLLFVRQGHYGKAWNLYRRSFGWNWKLRRWGYLAAFPLMIVCPPLRKAIEVYTERQRRRFFQMNPV